MDSGAGQINYATALPRPNCKRVAHWQFGRGNRLGDLRRLIRQYGRAADGSDTFPIGKFHKAGGASYGVDVNLPVTDNEKQNPNFTGCTDRKA